MTQHGYPPMPRPLPGRLSIVFTCRDNGGLSLLAEALANHGQPHLRAFSGSIERVGAVDIAAVECLHGARVPADGLSAKPLELFAPRRSAAHPCGGGHGGGGAWRGQPLRRPLRRAAASVAVRGGPRIWRTPMPGAWPIAACCRPCAPPSANCLSPCRRRPDPKIRTAGGTGPRPSSAKDCRRFSRRCARPVHPRYGCG